MFKTGWRIVLLGFILYNRQNATVTFLLSGHACDALSGPARKPPSRSSSLKSYYANWHGSWFCVRYACVSSSLSLRFTSSCQPRPNSWTGARAICERVRVPTVQASPIARLIGTMPWHWHWICSEYLNLYKPASTCTEPVPVIII